MSVAWSITGAFHTDDMIVTSVQYAAALGEHTSTGEVRLGPPPQNPMPYEDLTPQVMLGWVWGVVNKESAEAILLARSSEAQADELPWEITQP